jgi:putative endonuclease
MASVYILYSKSADEFYTGSSKDVEQRFDYHNKKEFPASYTAKYDDWELFFTIDNLEIGSVKKVEAHIKRMKSKIYIRNLTKYPEMVEKLVARYRDDSGSEKSRDSPTLPILYDLNILLDTFLINVASKVN